MQKPHFFTILLLLLALIVKGQEKFTISGFVKEEKSGEDLIGASVYSAEAKFGVVSNAYGFYSLTLPKGRYTIRVSYVGYETAEQKIDLDSNRTLTFHLRPAASQLQEVVIKADGPRQDVQSTQMGKTELKIQEIKELPAIFGEVDILKTLQLLPGVQGGSEGMAGFEVRGGAPDENLILLDEAVVYNPSHLFGFFSVFNSDAIKNVDLYKGGFPAEYGGRLSSVIDVSLKDGNKEEFHGSGGIGLIASRLTLEGPIKKDKASFIVSARRTYVDLFTRLINDASKNDPSYSPIPAYYFYDLNAKINWEINPKDRIFLSGYFGQDVFSFAQNQFNFNFNWGNATGTARWNHIFNPRLFMNTTLIYNDYRYDIKNSQDPFNIDIGSRILDWTAKTDFEYIPKQTHTIKFGGMATYHTFDVGRIKVKSGDSTAFDMDNTLWGTELGIYASDDWEATGRLKVNYGVRGSGFVNNGKFYYGIEPRLAARYLLKEGFSLKASYTDMTQYVHLVSNSGALLPTDVWYPSTPLVQPQLSQQVALGASTLLKHETIEVTDEVYYKWMQHEIDFKDGANLFLATNLDKQFVFGKGWAYANELFVRKSEGRLTGWVSYTLAWTFRQFDSINNGKPFSPKYDRRHTVDIVATYKLNKRVSVSATWVFTSGDAVSLPVAYMYVNDIQNTHYFILPVYTQRDGYRMPPYNRADVALVWKRKPRWGDADITFSVYNVYDRRNPYLIYIDQQLSTSGGTGSSLNLPGPAQAKQISLFPVIPSVTYNFRF